MKWSQLNLGMSFNIVGAVFCSILLLLAVLCFCTKFGKGKGTQMYEKAKESVAEKFSRPKRADHHVLIDDNSSDDGIPMAPKAPA